MQHSGVGSGVAPGARAPPCWIVLESFHKRETCFAGRIFRPWSGGPSPFEPPCGIERAWLREATAEKVGACAWSYVVLYYFEVWMSCDFQFKTSVCLTFL